MKEKFLALVKKVKEADISPITQTTNAEELKAAWEAFWADNQDLLIEIKDWAAEFHEEESDYIFAEGEEIENPMEITVIIRAIDDEDLTDENVFEEFRNLFNALNDIENNFATAIAELLRTKVITDITAEDIFSSDDEEDDDNDGDGDTDVDDAD